MVTQTTGTEKKIGSSLAKDLVMEVPAEIKRLLDEAIPLPKHRVHRKAATSARSHLYFQLWRSRFSTTGEISISQRLLDEMIGQRQRKKVMAAIKSSGVFSLAKRHVARIRCCTWHLADAFSNHYTSIESTTVPTYVATVGAGAPDSDYRCRYAPRTDCVGGIVPFVFEGPWRRRFADSFEVASKKIWNVDLRFKTHLRWSLSQTLIDMPTLDQCLRFADAAIAKAESRNCPKSLSRDLLAESYLDSWCRFEADPCHFCFRQRGNGRVYWGAVNQPKSLRRSNIRFIYGGKEVRGVEVDLSSSFFVFVAVESGCDALALAVGEDRVYETLADNCQQAFSNRDSLKVGAQVQCLFGAENFGRQPLFGAMYSIWPDAAKWVRETRRQHGVSGLSRMLMESEAAFMWDKLVPLLVKSRIPALPIHDGVIVPEPAAEIVQTLATDLIRKHCGVPGQFKIKF